METEKENNINKIFFNTLVLIGALGSIVIVLFDFIFPSTLTAKIVDFGIFWSCLISYLISKWTQKFTIPVIIFSLNMLSLMAFGFLNAGGYKTGIHICAMVMLGYGNSLMLKGKLRNSMHGIILGLLIALAIVQIEFPNAVKDNQSDIIFQLFIPYIVVYFAMAYSSGILRDKYDTANEKLLIANNITKEKNQEIATQNEALYANQEKLNQINQQLEEMVQLRTQKLWQKNEQLAQYSFENAHNVRGPLARLLGWLYLSSIDESIPKEQILASIKVEAESIDEILKKLSLEIYNNIDQEYPVNTELVIEI